MFLTRISVNQPVFATMVMIALMVFGVYSFQRLSVEELPDVDFPVVAVILSYPGASPEAVETDLIEPIEDAVNTISGIDEVRSTARSGSGTIILSFDMKVNSATAIQDVRDRLGSVQASLPEAAEAPTVARFDPDQMPIMSVAVTASGLSAGDLTDLTEDVVAQRFSTVPGVGSATVVGGSARELLIALDPTRMSALGVSVSEVNQVVAAENQDLPAGAVTSSRTESNIQVQGRLTAAQDFLDLIVARRDDEPIRLGDVATITESEAEITSLALLNGERALAVDIIKTQGANTVDVAHGVRTAATRMMEGELPDGVKLSIVRDNAVSVEESYHGVQNMLVEGAVLATLIVFLFLNSWRSTIITGLTLPISVIGTMTALLFLGFTLNMMTMLALSLAVGLLIDDAIVVRENIMRHLHMGKSHRQAALDGTNEIGLAVLATTLSIVAVFLPVAFMDGIIGRFFLQFGVTVSVAVLISMFVAFTLDPMMSSVWYDPSAHPGARRGPIGRAVAAFDRVFVGLGRTYTRVLRWSLRHRLMTLCVAVLSFGCSLALIPSVGVEFTPAADNSEFQVEIKTPPGSSLTYTETKVRQVESILRDFPEVRSTYATMERGTTDATIMALMSPPKTRERTPQQMTVPVRAALSVIPGIDVTVGSSGGMGGVSAPVQVSLYGENPVVLDRLSGQLVAELRTVRGLSDVESSAEAAQPILSVRVDRRAASDLGVSLSQVSASLRPMLAGEEVTDWTAPDGRNFKVQIRLPEELRQDAATLADLPIIGSGSSGAEDVVRLGEVATITKDEGPTEIRRLDLSRQISVSANLSNATMGDVMGSVQAAISNLDLPAGYRASTGGDAERISEAGASAGSALLLALIFIYLVLASQFGSFLQPLAIMASLPLAMIGVLLGLLIGGSTLNIFSVIGFIMLMGLVVKNAILLVDNANQHVRSGENLYDALVEAGETRFRPIVMTTMAMIFGMVPLAINLHGGTGQNAPMAHAVIGGLISSTLLTLVVVPVVVTYTDALGQRVSRLFPRPPDEEPLKHE